MSSQSKITKKDAQPSLRTVQASVDGLMSVVKQNQKDVTALKASAVKPAVAVSKQQPNAGRVVDATMTKSSFAHLENEGVDYGRGHRHGMAKNVGRRARRINGQKVMCDVWTGMERIATIVANSTTPLGQVLSEVELNPISFGTRLPTIATNYANFEFRVAKSRFMSAVTGFADCGLLYTGYQANAEAPDPEIGDGGMDDMSTWAADNKALIHIEGVTHDQRFAPVLQSATAELYVQGDDETRWSEQGRFILVNGGITDLTANAPDNVGHWFLEYEIELFNVNTIASPTSAVIGAGISLAVQASSPTASVDGNNLIPSPTDSASALMTQWIGANDVFAPVDFATTGGNMLILPGRYQINCTHTVGTAGSFTDMSSASLALISGTAAVITTSTPDKNVNVSTATKYMNSLTYGKTTSTIGPQYVGGVALTGGAPSSDYETVHTQFTVSVTEDAIFNLGSGTATYSGSPPTRNFRRFDMVVCRYGEQTVEVRNSPSNVVDGDVVLPPRFHAAARRLVLKAACAVRVSDATKMAVMTAALSAAPTEAPYFNTMIDCLSLPIPHLVCGPTAMHPGLDILLWLVQRFGPVLAAKALGVLQSTLRKWIADAKK